MSVVTYNGVTLPLNRTNGIEFRPQRSDDGMDYLYTKGTFDVRSIVSASLFATDYPGKTATEIMSQVEHKLNLPRKEFHYSVNAQDLVAIPAGRDVANGPFPQGVSIQEVSGAECYIINFKIDVAFIQCPDPPGNPVAAKWVSHRWSESEEKDQCAFSILTRRGKIIARGDMTASADELRELITPTLAEGFLRESAHYELSSDGLTLSYVFRDKEVYLQPPVLTDSVDDAFRAEGTYTQSSLNGATCFGECHVKLWGAKFTSKTDLIRQAIIMCMAKLDAADVQKDTKTNAIMLAGAVVRTELYENSCEVSIRAALKGLPARHKGVPISFASFESYPEGSDPDVADVASETGSRGSAGLELVANALKDPCLQTAVVRTDPPGPNGTTVTIGTGPGQSQVTIRVIPPDDLGAKLKTFIQSSAPLVNQGIYNTYEINTSYQLTTGAFMVPVADPKAPAELVQTARPQMMKVVDWTAQKIGAPPLLPSPQVFDTNSVVLDATYTPQEPKLSGDGVSMEFITTGRYLIGAKDSAKMVVGPGIPPWMEPGSDGKQAVLQSFQQSQFQTGVIDYADQNNGPTLAFLIDGSQLVTGGGGGTGGPGN